MSFQDHSASSESPRPLKHGVLTGGIIAAAMEVHRVPGPGFQEYVYQRALEREFMLRSIPAIREFDMFIFYKEVRIATRRVDFLVESLITVELKAVSELTPVNLAQALNYLETYNVEVGMLPNFGSPGLQYKRLHNKRYRPIMLNRE